MTLPGFEAADEKSVNLAKQEPGEGRRVVEERPASAGTLRLEHVKCRKGLQHAGSFLVQAACIKNLCY